MSNRNTDGPTTKSIACDVTLRVAAHATWEPGVGWTPEEVWINGYEIGHLFLDGLTSVDVAAVAQIKAAFEEREREEIEAGQDRKDGI